ncbi:hypothetical protein TNCV_3355281 [Trichonephila clavipes]|nr:hypothetical protein TNCV_3355281 [Trichonephila clavipes]
MVTNSWSALSSSEFALMLLKKVEGLMRFKYVEAQFFHVRLRWKFLEGGTTLNVLLFTSPRFRMCGPLPIAFTLSYSAFLSSVFVSIHATQGLVYIKSVEADIPDDGLL